MKQYFKNFGNMRDKGIKNNSFLKTELVENSFICSHTVHQAINGEAVEFKYLFPEFCPKPSVQWA